MNNIIEKFALDRHAWPGPTSNKTIVIKDTKQEIFDYMETMDETGGEFEINPVYTIVNYASQKIQ